MKKYILLFLLIPTFSFAAPPSRVAKIKLFYRKFKRTLWANNFTKMSFSKNYFKIFNSIVNFYSIFMMNYFNLLKFSTKMLFHHIPVFKNFCFINCTEYISSFTKISSTFPCWRIFPRRGWNSFLKFCRWRSTMTFSPASFRGKKLTFFNHKWFQVSWKNTFKTNRMMFSSACFRTKPYSSLIIIKLIFTHFTSSCSIFFRFFFKIINSTFMGAKFTSIKFNKALFHIEFFKTIITFFYNKHIISFRYFFIILYFINMSILNCTAAPPSRVATYVPNTVISSDDVTANEDAIFSYLQSGLDSFADGSIINADINSSANIQSDKLNLTSISQAVGITSGGSLSNAGAFTQTGTSTFAGTTITSLGTVTTGIFTAIKIDSGVIDGTAIGGTTPTIGTFTDLIATSTFKTGSTRQGDVLYDNGTSIIRLAPGTSGQFLKTQGSGANPTWADSGLKLISTTTASNAATTGNITISENKMYKYEVMATDFSNGDSNAWGFGMRMNGDTASAYAYSKVVDGLGGTTTNVTSEVAEAGATSIIIVDADGGAIGTQTRIKGTGYINTMKNGSTSRFYMDGEFFYDDASRPANVEVFGVFEAATAPTSFSFISEEVMDITVRLYEFGQ